MRSLVVSIGLLAIAALYLLLIVGVTFDLFFIVSFLTASLMVKEAGAWLLGYCSIFDPAAFVSLFSYIYFFISPVMQVHWQYWISFPELQYHSDWIVFWGVVNLFGAAIYRVVVSRMFGQAIPLKSYRYQFNEKRFYLTCLALALIGFACQVYIYAKFGGIDGFVSVFSERQAISAAEFDPFAGMGIEMLLADGARNIFALIIVVYFANKKRKVKASR